MNYALVGTTHVVVHGPRPGDAEWQTYLAELLAHAHLIRGLIAHAPYGGSLTLAQRRAATSMWQRHGSTPRMAIMTSSTITRGVVSSLSWFLGTNVRAFAVDEFARAGDHLGLDDATLAGVRDKIAELHVALAA